MSAAPARTDAAPAAAALEGFRLRAKPRSLWSDAWRQFRRHRLAMAGTVVIALLVLLTVVGPLVWRTPIDTIDFAASKAAPSARHPVGTNDLGQDLLARIIWGGRISLAVGLAAMLVAITVGVVVGALAGFFGKATDSLLMRLTDLFLALPTLPLLLLVVYLFRDTMRGAFGPILGVFLIIVLVIGGLNWMPTARLVRAEFLSVKEKEFVEAARAIGVPTRRIMVRHLFPNALAPVIVSLAFSIPGAMLAEATLSFIGIGIKPPTATWGVMINEGFVVFSQSPWPTLLPAFCISIVMLAFTFLGDGLRDALDPRMKT